MPPPRIRLLVACLLTASALSACSDDASSTLAGEVVPGRPSLEIVGDFGYVLLPSGRIDVVVGEAVGGVVAADEASDDHDHHPPDGGSWIPVHVFHDPYGDLGVPLGVIGGSPQPAQVALVVDGTTVSLGAPYRVVGEEGTAASGLDNVWVAVDGRPDEIESVQVAVTYDGLTQTLDPGAGTREAGAAEPLYAGEPTELPAQCDGSGFDRGRLRVDAACAIGPAQRTPYLPGSGWAADGGSWLVVGAAVSIEDVTVGGTSYDVTRLEPRLTVEGDGPLPPYGRYGEVRRDPLRVSGDWAYAVAATGDLEADLRLELVLAKGDDADPGPRTRRVTVHQSVRLG
jgi:hypothetical protein